MAVNDWLEYKRLVLAEIERLDQCMASLKATINRMEQRCFRHGFDEEEEEKHIEHGMVRWKFWGIVITVVGAIITSIVGLAVSLFHGG